MLITKITNPLYLTADLHYFHSNILTYCSRPYSTVEEMNDALITNWKTKISPGDNVRILGDVGFCGLDKLREIRIKLNGNIVTIKGNHDKTNKLISAGFYPVLLEEFIEYKDKIFRLTHHPPNQNNRSKRFYHLHLHGQSHSTSETRFNKETKSFDVGVDGNNYFPISLDEIIEITGI